MFDDQTELDTGIAEMERKWRDAGIPNLYAGGDGPISRERYRNVRSLLYPTPELMTGSVEDLSIPASAGHSIPIRIIHPAGHDGVSQLNGTVVFFHGGGWMVGGLDTHQGHAVRIANLANVVVVNVDYRLAPEFPFPAGFQDCLDAVRWVDSNGTRLGGENSPLVVGGDSAGGNLAAAVALACAQENVSVAAQFLLYPVTDSRIVHNEESHRAYFGTTSTDMQDWRASPILSDNLDKAPPTIIAVGCYDYLLEENKAYAAALQAAGVSVSLVMYPSLNHGFFSYTAISEASRAAADDLCERLRVMLAEKGSGLSRVSNG